jgi:predicted acyl esterase
MRRILLLVIAVVATCTFLVHSAESERNAQVAERAKAIAVQFDKDKDGCLSTDEQAGMLKFVEQVHGKKWSEQLDSLLKKADTNGDGVVDRAEWERALKAIRRPKAANPGIRKVTHRVAMSDGAKLATDVYLPQGEGPFPVILTRTPYSRTKANAASFIASHGIAFVIQDMRGRFDSEGENIPFIGCGWADHCDGAETVAWILKQPWCNGKVGTVGGSACGITQNLLAGTGAPGLAAQCVQVAAASMYHHAAYVGGALRKCQVDNWTTGNRFDPLAMQLMVDHPCYDDYWHRFDSTRRFEQMNVPAVHFGGWFDTFLQGTIDEFVGRQHHGAEGSRGTQKMVIGPWDHGGWRREGVGELTFPNAQPPEEYSEGLWFGHYLNGENNGVENQPPVAYYTMGDTSDPKAPGNQWRRANDWPVPSSPTSYYFGPDGSLSTTKPTAAEAHRQYTFDPADPCPTIGGNNLTIPRGPRAQNAIEGRSDVLLFTTASLAEPLEVTGQVIARIHLTASTPDTDLSVRLCDVYPNGKSYLIAEGMLRARYRRSFTSPEPLPQGEVVGIDVPCWPTSIVFNRGHRLRVTVTSSNSPRFDVNPGTGKPLSAKGEKLKQLNRIHCDAGHPSCVVLPVVKAQ